MDRYTVQWYKREHFSITIKADSEDDAIAEIMRGNFDQASVDYVGWDEPEDSFFATVSDDDYFDDEEE